MDVAKWVWVGVFELQVCRQGDLSIWMDGWMDGWMSCRQADKS